MDFTKKINGTDYSAMIAEAVSFFWNKKQKQLSESGDSSNRGAVVGGKQMDGFVGLLKKVACDAGVPSEYIITDKNYLPGFLPFIKRLGYDCGCTIGETHCCHRIKISSRFIW